jgi:hypothetical protein
MQWPTTELVFPLFSTLLLLLKKRAAPDTHELAISVIYGTDSISSMVMTHSCSVQNYSKGIRKPYIRTRSDTQRTSKNRAKAT